MKRNNLYYKRPINLPKTGHELVTCHYPLRLDTYSGCIHNCVYCYAKNLLENRGYWNPVRIANASYIEKLLERLLQNSDDSDSISSAVRRRVPFRLGGLTDCFQDSEKQNRVTENVLEILNRYEYPYLIVTKSPLVADYVDLLDERLAVIQITITTLKENLSKAIEPNAPKPLDRLRALQILSDSGYFTTARFSPIIPNVNLAEADKLFEAYSNAGAKHVLVEFFRGTLKMIKRVELATNKKIKQRFMKNGYYYRFNFNEKLVTYKYLKELANEFGMKFSICSDGDPIPFELNDTKNCCGTDGFKNFRGVERVASTLYWMARNRGKVTLNDMLKYWSPTPEVFERFWFSGAFERFVFGLKWNGEEYVLKR
ncbi:hypothetical protein DRP04_05005 [Archaeoglobales archaeon]|nr:MAG: hypothetical protein DRP04_05005 [Archaeoglobales archaeon]